MKRKLLFAIVALLCSIGMRAYTVSDLTSAGWTQVTDLSSLTLADNYFMLIDAGTSNYAVTNGAPSTTEKPVYYSLVNPFAVAGEVWIISESNGNYTLQGIEDNYYFNSGSAGWNDSMTENKENAEFTFTPTDGKYSIKSVTTGKWCGPWNNDGSVKLTDGIEGIAANKDEAQAPGFYLYAITRSAYNAVRRNAAALVSEGWTLVTEVSGLGLSGYYYAILDASETGVESGYALTGTGGRPTYTPLTDPTSNNAQKWTLEAHGDGYALKDMSSSKYVYSAANWNMQATDNINTAHTDYIPTYVNDGKWTLSNSISTGEFVGTYSNTTYQPFENEGTASNKAAGAGKRQFIFYSIPTIAGVAEALPVSGDMVADTWYYIDIPATADNYTATATDLSKIVYSANAGTTVVPHITTNTFTAEDNSLAAQRYYVKSSTDNNLVIGVSSYTYNVGTPTPSIADGAYIASLSTINFTFSDAGTTDPDASFALLNGSAKAVLTKGGVDVAEGTLSLSGKVLTATFSDIALALSSTYNITIAAGVVGYAGEETSVAISTSFNTGIIADGVYYFKKKGEYKYLTRGGNYGTETVVDNYGLSFEAAIQADGKYYLKNVDHSLSANAAKYLNTYTDGAAYGWTIATATGGYYLIDSDSKYLTAAAYDYTDDNSNTNTYYYQSRTSTEGEAIVWELLSKSEYATSLTAKKNAEIAALATAAGISASTLSEFESALSTDYGTTDMTSSISNPLCNSASGWTAVSYNGGSKYTAVDYHAPTIQVWNCTGGITQSISSLPEGLYKVTVSATWRPGNSVSATRVGNEANTTAWIYANDNITQMKGWYEGGGTINSTQDLIDNASSYVNTVYVYLDGTEDLKIGVAVPAFCVENWCPIYNWTLTRYEAKATTAEKTALANAIDTYDKIGFEDAEYAPYNNIEAIAALAAAKAIDPETASGAAVVAATTALTGATWTPNDGEQNAIYWEDYTAGDIAGDSYIHPLGWTNTGYNTRIYSEAAGNKDTNAGISAVNNLAMMFKYNTTYGETEGYTMPLKAATVYKITFKYCGWGNTPTTNIVLTDPESNAISLAPGFRPATNDGNTNASDWYEYTGYFASTTAGDYVLAFNKADGGQQQIGIGDMELVSATELPFADGSVPTYAPGTYPTVKITRTLTADRWATAVYPFAVSGVDNIAVLNSYDASTGALGFTSAAASTANVPFLMRSTAGTSEISLNDVAVAATSATDATVSEASLKGVYASTDITSAEKNYVLSNNTIYPVGAAGATINPYRAYIQIDQAGETRNLTFFVDGEEATAIENVNDEPSTANPYYDLSGRRVVKPTKGLYIVNGKKVMVK